MNSRSPIARLLFTVLTVSVALGAASTARADRVVLYPVTGDANDERLAQIGDAIAQTVQSLGHETITGAAIRPARSVTGVPGTSDQMADVATTNRAQWVVVADVAMLAGQYRLHLRVGYGPVRRVEELEVNVVMDEEAPRLSDVLRCMLRPEGLGEDVVRLTSGDEAAQQAAAAEAARRAQEEAAQRAQEEAALRAQEEARHRAEEEARQREAAAVEQRRLAQLAAERAHAFGQREQYGAGATPWIFQIGAAGSAILSADHGAHTPPHAATALFTSPLRLGYAIPGVTGLELRGGADLVLGATNGGAIVGGVFYLASPLSIPVFFGGGIEAGAFFATSGSQSAAFLARFLATVSWKPTTAPVYLEADIGISDLTSSSVLSFEAGARLGYRF